MQSGNCIARTEFFLTGRPAKSLQSQAGGKRPVKKGLKKVLRLALGFALLRTQALDVF